MEISIPISQESGEREKRRGCLAAAPARYCRSVAEANQSFGQVRQLCG